MELQEFIQNALVEISKGIDGAKKELGNTTIGKTEICPIINHSHETKEFVEESSGRFRKVHEIEFDIAIDIGKKNGSKTGIAVLTTIISAAGSKAKETSSSTTHRIKFNIPIKFA